MFILTQNINGAEVIPDLTRPILGELDSTNASPDPSVWVPLRLRLPVDYESRFNEGSNGASGGVTINFEGTYANLWDISKTSPVAGQPQNSQIRVEVISGQSTFFWVRTSTVFNETPIDDRSVGVKVDGEIKKVTV